jgi:hypothetical protein
MKPFNLERALAGEPVVTRDGKKVVEIIHLSSMRNERNVLAVFENDCMLYTHNGTCIFNEPHYSDLFMATEKEKKSVWVNVYEDKFSDEFTLGIQHKTLESATNNIRGNEDYIKTIQITNEI